MPGLNYYRRIISAYLTNELSQLSFWHDTPAINNDFVIGQLNEYYMNFTEKANYTGPFDAKGIPLLDYHGIIGKQYNPIAIAQYGLGNYNLFKRTSDEYYKASFFSVAEWLVDNLKPNAQGVYVWPHQFDWEYREGLKAPWYSALAQGQGISVLTRAYIETKNRRYLEAAEKAYDSFKKEIELGGVIFTDDCSDLWFEEYIVEPPSHILNGFIWALWGVYDYYLCFKSADALKQYNQGLQTIKNNLAKYDTGFWSLYDLGDGRMKNYASPFYHRLHIIQLKVLCKISGEELFMRYAEKWQKYADNPWFSSLALINKGIFKLLHY